MKMCHHLDVWIWVVSAFLVALFASGYWYTSRYPIEPVRRAPVETQP